MGRTKNGNTTTRRSRRIKSSTNGDVVKLVENREKNGGYNVTEKKEFIRKTSKKRL